MDNEAINCHLGKYIEAKRLEKALTQRRLAHLLGVSENYISEIEGGHRNASFSVVFRLMQVLESSANALFYLSGDKKDHNDELLLRIYQTCTDYEKMVVYDTLQILVSSLKKKAAYEKADAEHQQVLQGMGGSK